LQVTSFIESSHISTQKQHEPFWNLTEWIEATPEHLMQITKVIYQATVVPSGKRIDLPPVTCCAANKFSLLYPVVGSFPLTATLYLYNGTRINLGPTYFQAIVP